MRIIYFIVVFIISLVSFSQKDYTRYYNSWRLGLNLGGAWQTADYRSCYGMGGGFTLEKGFHENSTNVFSFAIRGRYLGANTYGMDYNRNYDVKSNDAYNGKYNPKVNFVDSVSSARQYVYDNYKMKLNEGALELQITFNRLRERTHVLLNLWGGIGFTGYETKSDLVDASGKMYDFSSIDSTGNKAKVLRQYNSLIDSKYESYAYANNKGNLYTFSPSAGIGLGYQFSPGFSMLWEYKVTFPQGSNADLLDGKLAANGDFFGSNDYYHYTGLNLVFTLRGKHKTKTASTETVHTNSVLPVQPVVVPTNSVSSPPPTNSVVTNVQAPISEAKPIISFINPTSNAFVVTAGQYKISAKILNITSSNQIQLKVNGVTESNFSFNIQSHVLEFNSNLNNGSNSIQITASNTAGQINKYTTVIYNQPKELVSPPLVTFSNPTQPGEVVSNKIYVIKAQVLNVSAQSQITVYYNGTSTLFTYNSATQKIEFTANLNMGVNTVSVVANNAGGTDLKTTNIVYRPVKTSGVSPVVNLISPSSISSASNNLNYSFRLSVLNVNAKSDIGVMFNGVNQSNFSYDMNTKELAFTSNLINGNNTLIVKGTNQFGVDTKQITVSYSPRIKLKALPVITFVTPLNASGSSGNMNYNYVATVTNVENVTGITVKYNGMAINNFSFDGFNLTYSALLNIGANNLEISATNSDGNDIKNGVVTYKPKALPKPPVVSVLKPIGSPVTSDKLFGFSFKVTNVSQNQVQVFLNGSQISQFNFAGSMGSFSANLIGGNNNVMVKATNADGTDSKSETIFFKEPPPPADTAMATSTSSTSTNFDSNGNKLVVICHKAPGVEPKTISVLINLLSLHLGHGDTNGACPSKTDPIKITPVNPGLNSGRGGENEIMKDSTQKKTPINTPRSPR